MDHYNYAIVYNGQGTVFMKGETEKWGTMGNHHMIDILFKDGRCAFVSCDRVILTRKEDISDELVI